MTMTEIQKKTKFVRTSDGKVSEVILPYTIYQELLELKARVDEILQSKEKEDLPNAETRQAIYEAEQGINLVVCENADDLFKRISFNKGII